MLLLVISLQGLFVGYIAGAAFGWNSAFWISVALNAVFLAVIHAIIITQINK